jgi:hypothetical protein
MATVERVAAGHFLDNQLVVLEVGVGAAGVHGLIVGMAQLLGRSVVGLLDHPFRSTLLTDFWGRRWNHLVHSNLAKGFYWPLARAGHRALGSVAAFAASGVMHTVAILGAGSLPTVAMPCVWILWCFLGHGAAVLIEQRLGWNVCPPDVCRTRWPVSERLCCSSRSHPGSSSPLPRSRRFTAAASVNRMDRLVRSCSDRDALVFVDAVYGVRRRCMLRTRVLTSLLACLVFLGLARADEAHGPDSERWMSLPRLREVWQREGLGRRSGVAGMDAYYTLTDDGKAVVALDGATGRDRWRWELPRPVDADGQGMWEGGLLGFLLGDDARPFVLAGADLLVATSISHGRSVSLASLDARTGQPRWSRTVECGYFQVVRSAGDWVLQCGRGWSFENNSLLVLSAKDGAQRAKLTMTEPFAVAPGGGICTTGKARVSCFRLQGGRLVQRWSRSVTETASPNVQATASFVVRLGERAQVFRLSDGRPLFERPPAAWTSVDPSQERMCARRGPDGGGAVERWRERDVPLAVWSSHPASSVQRTGHRDRAAQVAT